MPIMFIISIIVLIIALVATVVWLVTKPRSGDNVRPVRREGESSFDYDNRLYRWQSAHTTESVPGYVPAAAFALFAVCLIFSSLTMVGTKNYGVVTTFGRVNSDTLDAGLHLKAPWQKVTDISTAIQPDEFDGKEAYAIRIGNGSIAKIDVTIRWRIVGAKAGELFQDYRGEDDVTDAVRTALVKRELNGALNEVFGEYDPLAAVKGGENVTVDSLSAAVEDAMRERVQALGQGDAQVEVLSVTTPLIILDDNTQEKIDQYQAQVALTRIAEERIETNKAEAKANAAIAESVDNPLVLTNKCLGIMETLAKSGGVPAGLYCFAGGNAPVIVPGSGGSGSNN